MKHAGEGGSLAHALRILTDGTGECGVETDSAEGHLGGAGATAGASAVAVEFCEVVEVFEGGELVVEHRVVAHVGDAVALLAGRAGEDADGAATGFEEAGEEAEESGFAGTVVPEDDCGGADRELGGDVAEGDEATVELRGRIEARSRGVGRFDHLSRV